jgi:murein DD-endopeptidase MepM/ murein hydrolase activator NlpD
MRLLWLLAAFSLASFSVAASSGCDVRGLESDAPVLCGNPVQGGLLYGESDWLVSDEDNAFSSPVQYGLQGPDGVFAIGIPMNAGKKLRLRFCRDGKCSVFNYGIGQRNYAEQRVSVAAKFVDYPPGVRERIDSENEKIRASRGVFDTSFIGFADWEYPFVEKYPTSGSYGNRRVFNGVGRSPHRGWDIAAPMGALVRSIGPGKVVLTIDSYMSGKTVIISHGYGVFSIYAHLGSVNVRQDGAVSAGSVVGTVGSTGRASGPHLHLGLYRGDEPLDPELLFL